MNMRFCFKVKDKYICKKVQVERDPLPRHKYDVLKNKLRAAVAKDFKCNSKQVIPITLNHYLDKTDSR